MAGQAVAGWAVLPLLGPRVSRGRVPCHFWSRYQGWSTWSPGQQASRGRAPRSWLGTPEGGEHPLSEAAEGSRGPARPPSSAQAPRHTSPPPLDAPAVTPGAQEGQRQQTTREAAAEQRSRGWWAGGRGGPARQRALSQPEGANTRKTRGDAGTGHVGRSGSASGALGRRAIRGAAASRRCTCSSRERARSGQEGRGFSLPLPRAAAWRAHLLPLGSSACLASLRSAAAKLEDGAAWADSALLVAGLPLGTRAPLSGEGVRGLTVAVVLVAVESIPSEGDLGSWLMPETGKEEPESPREQEGPAPERGLRGPGRGRGAGASGRHAGRASGSRQNRASAAERRGRDPSTQGPPHPPGSPIKEALCPGPSASRHQMARPAQSCNLSRAAQRTRQHPHGCGRRGTGPAFPRQREGRQQKGKRPNLCQSRRRTWQQLGLAEQVSATPPAQLW